MGRTGRREAGEARFAHHAGSVGGIQGRPGGAPEKQASVFLLASCGGHATRELNLRDLFPGRAAARGFGNLPLYPNLGLPAIVHIKSKKG
ncbi:hypothetical protein LBMAG41_08070 [Cyanobium sp.]|nr:hypothetical protein LBMAG41_08070 [Cyanobium sp.]